MGVKTELVEKRNELDDLRKKMAKINTESKDGNDFDFSKATDLTGDKTERLDQYRKNIARMDDLGKEVQALADAVRGTKESYEEQEIKSMIHPQGQQESKSLGQRFFDSPSWKAYKKGDIKFDQINVEFPEINLKTLMTTSAGWAPPTIRTGEVVMYPTEATRFFDFLPKANTGAAAVTYMEETTRDQDMAAETEGSGVYNESTYVLTERSVTVQNIASYVTVTDQQIEDVPQMQDLIDTELRMGLREQLDEYAITGSGIAPIPLGILYKSGIGTQVADGDQLPDAVYKAMVKVQAVGKADPNFVLVNPYDWQTVRLQRTDDGVYIWGNPSTIGPETLWGLPVIKSTRITKGTSVTGDAARFGKYFERRGVLVEMTDSHDTNFIYGIKCIRATVRGCFRWSRAAAFCKVTGIA
jgi:hypothetical protein